MPRRHRHPSPWLFPTLCLAAGAAGALGVADWLAARPYAEAAAARQAAASVVTAPGEPRSPGPPAAPTLRTSTTTPKGTPGDRTPTTAEIAANSTANTTAEARTLDASPDEPPRSRSDASAGAPGAGAPRPGRDGPASSGTAGPRPRAAALIAGLDRRPGGLGVGRADTLLLLFLDEAAGGPARAGLVSLPRDLYVDVPGHGPARINATLRIARRLGEDGSELLRRVTEDTLAVTIDHVLLVDLGGFEAMVDAVGGVDVRVPCPIVDRFEDERTGTGRRLLDVPAGPAVPMDGVTAAMYVRSRHGRSDFSRAHRQQAVVEALLRKARSPWLWPRLPALVEVAEGLLETRASRAELLALAHRVIRGDVGHLRKTVLGARYVSPHRTVEGRSVLQPEGDALKAAVRRLFTRPKGRDRPIGSECPPADIALVRP